MTEYTADAYVPLYLAGILIHEDTEVTATCQIDEDGEPYITEMVVESLDRGRIHLTKDDESEAGTLWTALHYHVLKAVRSDVLEMAEEDGFGLFDPNAEHRQGAFETLGGPF